MQSDFFFNPRILSHYPHQQIIVLEKELGGMQSCKNCVDCLDHLKKRKTVRIDTYILGDTMKFKSRL